MDPLKEQIEKLAKIDEQISALLANDELTDAQLAEHDSLVEQRGKVSKKIDLLKAQAERDQQREALSASLPAPAPVAQRRTQPDSAANGGGGNITSQRLAAADDPMKGFKTPREFMSAVMQHGMGSKMDERLGLLRQAAVGSDEHSGSDNNYGGFLVPVAMSPDFLQLTPEADPMAGRVRSVPMESTSVKFGARVDKNHSDSVSGGLTVTRKPETTAAASSRMAVENVELTAFSLFGLAYATEEILVDSPISFAALIAAGFNQEFTSHIINERLNGTGVGEFLGVLNSPCLVTVGKESGQAADTILYENVIKMRARCWGYGNAFWLANQDCLPQLMLMNQAVGTGGVPVWQPSAREDAPDVLLGRPLIFTEYAKTIGDKGDLVLGNWMEYLEGVYQPLQSAESVHVRFVNHERTFKFWTRNAGAPWWKSPLTPKNSANTLSPFVTLEAR